MPKYDALLSLKEGKVNFYDEIQINPNLAIDDDIYNISIEFLDSRRITHQQRKFIYAMLKDISIHINGYVDEIEIAYYKGIFKSMLIEKELVDDYFSLSDCSVTQANLMIDLLISIAFEYNIALNANTRLLNDDLERWQYYCLKFGKCCICGLDGEIHHEDTISMGNNRKTLDDSNKRKMCLCRNHHTEKHTMGENEFFKKYYVVPILYEGR